MKLTRRDVLKISGSTAVALAACGPQLQTEAELAHETQAAILPHHFAWGSDVSKLHETAEFALSVAAGEVTSTSAVLWTRYLSGFQVSLHVWDEASDSVVWDNRAVRFSHGFAHEFCGVLEPGKRYSYAFVAGNRRSPVGRFRAAIAETSLEPVTFMGYSCTHYDKEPYPALMHAAKRNDLDFWVCGGDKVYCDDLNGKQSSYRSAYARAYRQDGYFELHKSAATYGSWDDHEFTESFNPKKTAPEVTALAKQTYFEHHPIKRREDDRLWRSFRWGHTVELFILDCRTERDSATDTYISREQMDWLKQGLADSPCMFKMIVNSVPIGNFPLVFDAKAYDRWTGYKQQREEILSHINDGGIRDVWWLSGDFHLGAVGKVEKNGPSALQREVVWGPGGKQTNPLYVLLNEPQWDYSTGDSSYTVLSCDPIAKTVKVSIVNDQGKTLFDRVYASVANAPVL